MMPLLLAACQSETPKGKIENADGNLAVSPAVIAANKSVADYLDMDDNTDFENAERGFIATFEETVVRTDEGGFVYDFGAYEFLKNPAPDTANPSLWRQSQLASKHGLFKVMDGIYQVRGYDVSNITFIRGKTGWIVVDPLISKEVAAKAKELVDRELGVLPVTGVIFTHSHLDHYGGVRGLISETDVANGVEIIAPDGFVRETVSENILAGNAMGRRASYMFGSLLPKQADGQIGVGLGQTISSGTPGLLYPTINVDHTGQKVTVDGVEMDFILTLDAEAPSEFMFYLPQFKAFCQVEIINHTFHNLYTPRGAKVRDGRRWAKYIDEAIYLFGDKAEVSFGSHHWPTWGQEQTIKLWTGQRDVYRYVHDQTVRLANQGYTMHEIPQRLNVPDGIAKSFANRGYYGTVSHNSKAQYQLYFGYFDGNPANLNPLGPVEAGKKFVSYMGGAQNVIDKARADYDKGEFRFAATALNNVVFAEPDNETAANLLADTYTQMGYMAESGSWRDFYLTGASELRHGIKDLPTIRTSSPDMVRAIPLDLYFDLLAVRLNGPEAAKNDRNLNFELTDTKEKALLMISNGTLHHRLGHRDDNAPTLKLTRTALDQLNLKQKTFDELMEDGSLSIDGNPLAVQSFFALIEEPEFWFEIVRP
ncbi:MAG: MBL fold metallo-hydrolase [Robiginitomaculum sp.]|nr:MBL fold metallo-hydrolase [Robiginitomaculum sp.]